MHGPRTANIDDANPPAEVLLYAGATHPDPLGRIVVPVMLNEQGPFQFLLDTGATRTVLSETVATQLGLSPDRQQTVRIRSVMGLTLVPTVVIHSLQMGAFSKSQLRMPVLSNEALQSADGVLGVDSIGDTKIIADIKRQHIRIATATGSFAEQGRIVIAFEQIARQPLMVDARLGDIRVRAVVDTGCADTLGNAVLLKKLRRRLPATQLSTHPTEILDATDTVVPAQVVGVPRVIIGKLLIDNLRVSFGEFSVFDTWHIDKEPVLLIGMDVLSQLDELAIDYRRKELQVAVHTPD